MNIQLPGHTLRPVTRDSADLGRILEVYRQCEDFLSLGPVPTASMDMVLADLELSKTEGGVFYAIEESVNGEMVGVVDFALAGFEGNPQLAFLSLLMIAAPHRGRGLGEAVVQAVEAAIRQDGRATVIRSGVQVNNPGGIRFWQRMGYRIISGPEPMADGTVTFQLWKDL